MTMTLSEGIRFNVVAIIMEFGEEGRLPNGLTTGTMTISHKVVAESVPQSRLNYEVHAARLTYGEDNVRLEPTQLYTPAEFGLEA